MLPFCGSPAPQPLPVECNNITNIGYVYIVQKWPAQSGYANVRVSLTDKNGVGPRWVQRTCLLNEPFANIIGNVGGGGSGPGG